MKKCRNSRNSTQIEDKTNKDENIMIDIKKISHIPTNEYIKI